MAGGVCPSAGWGYEHEGEGLARWQERPARARGGGTNMAERGGSTRGRTVRDGPSGHGLRGPMDRCGRWASRRAGRAVPARGWGQEAGGRGKPGRGRGYPGSGLGSGGWRSGLPGTGNGHPVSGSGSRHGREPLSKIAGEPTTDPDSLHQSSGVRTLSAEATMQRTNGVSMAFASAMLLVGGVPAAGRTPTPRTTTCARTCRATSSRGTRT